MSVEEQKREILRKINLILKDKTKLRELEPLLQEKFALGHEIYGSLWELLFEDFMRVKMILISESEPINPEYVFELCKLLDMIEIKNDPTYKFPTFESDTAAADYYRRLKDALFSFYVSVTKGKI